MLDAYSTAATTRVSDSQYGIGLCVSLAVRKAHFAVWTILVSLETMSIIFFLDASPGVFVLTSLGSLSLIGSALTAPFQTLMEGHSMDLNS